MHRNQEKLGPIGCPTHSWCYAWDIQLSVIFPSGSPNKSVATSIAPVTAPQGPQEAHSLRLLVPGAVRWGCGWHIPTNTKIFILESQQIHWYLICPCRCSPRPPGGTWPTPFGPWCWCCSSNPQVTHQWIRPIMWLIRWAIKLQDRVSSFREHALIAKTGFCFIYVVIDQFSANLFSCDENVAY